MRRRRKGPHKRSPQKGGIPRSSLLRAGCVPTRRRGRGAARLCHEPRVHRQPVAQLLLRRAWAGGRRLMSPPIVHHAQHHLLLGCNALRGRGASVRGRAAGGSQWEAAPLSRALQRKEQPISTGANLPVFPPRRIACMRARRNRLPRWRRTRNIAIKLESSATQIKAMGLAISGQTKMTTQARFQR